MTLYAKVLIPQVYDCEVVIKKTFSPIQFWNLFTHENETALHNLNNTPDLNQFLCEFNLS